MKFGDKNHNPKNMKNNGDDGVHAAALKKTGHWGKQAAGCIFLARETGNICLNLRSKDVLEPLTWGTWGGAIDVDENPREAVRRESQEEVGETIKMDLIPLLLFTKPGFKYHNFLAVIDKEFTPKLDWESKDYKWTSLDDLPKPLHPGLKALLQDKPSMEKIKNNIEKHISEDVPTVSAGSGSVAGIGIGAQGEPGSPKRSLIRRSKFAGHEVFEVDGDVYHQSRLGKSKHHRYAKYVGEDEVGSEIRQYGRENPGKPIILKHNVSGALQFLKYGRYS